MYKLVHGKSNEINIQNGIKIEAHTNIVHRLGRESSLSVLTLQGYNKTDTSSLYSSSEWGGKTGKHNYQDPSFVLLWL